MCVAQPKIKKKKASMEQSPQLYGVFTVAPSEKRAPPSCSLSLPRKPLGSPVFCCEGTRLSHFCALGPFPGCWHRTETHHQMEEERKQVSCFQRPLL